MPPTFAWLPDRRRSLPREGLLSACLPSVGALLPTPCDTSMSSLVPSAALNQRTLLLQGVRLLPVGAGPLLAAVDLPLCKCGGVPPLIWVSAVGRAGKHGQAALACQVWFLTCA